MINMNMIHMITGLTRLPAQAPKNLVHPEDHVNPVEKDHVVHEDTVNPVHLNPVHPTPCHQTISGL